MGVKGRNVVHGLSRNAREEERGGVAGQWKTEGKECGGCGKIGKSVAGTVRGRQRPFPQELARLGLPGRVASVILNESPQNSENGEATEKQAKKLSDLACNGRGRLIS